MQMDRDGIISILIGVILIFIAWFWKSMEVSDPLAILVGLFIEMIRGGLLGLGLLFVLVGLLFIFG